MDNLLIVSAFFVTFYYRDNFVVWANYLTLPFPQEVHQLGEIPDYLIILGVCLPLFNATLSVFGAYRSMRFSSLFRVLKNVSLSAAVVFFSASAIFFIIKQDTSRSFLGIFCVLTGIALFVERVLVLKVLRYLRVKGKNFRNLLIVGTGDLARQLYIEISGEQELGMRAAGFVDLRSDAVPMKAVGSSGPRSDDSVVYDLPARVVANASTFERALKKHAIDEVLFTDVMTSYPVVKDLAQIAAEEGVGVSFAADFFSLGIMNSDTSYLGTVPLVHYRPSPGDSSTLVFKRVFDAVASAGLLVCLAPVLMLTAVLIKLDSKGPIFFRQRRVGLNGRTFILLKFRSMVLDAESKLDSLREFNEMDGPVFKMKNDPRVTPLGRFIRRYSIDELPQLLNVLWGDMSLVGPRPPIPDEVSLYMRKQRRRLSMRPGLTCTWQVSGRNEIPDFEEWARLDLEYIDNWSLKKDFNLLLKTIPAVLRGTGAR
jgi:exopolysaccharide biosynthesis polyprenyl glycosylphosphotransferase